MLVNHVWSGWTGRYFAYGHESKHVLRHIPPRTAPNIFRSPANTAALTRPFSKSDLYQGLNGVNRQQSNGQNINGQPSKTQYFYRQPPNKQTNVSRQMSKVSLNKNYTIALIRVKFYCL